MLLGSARSAMSSPEPTAMMTHVGVVTNRLESGPASRVPLPFTRQLTGTLVVDMVSHT
jgi:hypothetical protein